MNVIDTVLVIYLPFFSIRFFIRSRFRDVAACFNSVFVIIPLLALPLSHEPVQSALLPMSTPARISRDDVLISNLLSLMHVLLDGIALLLKDLILYPALNVGLSVALTNVGEVPHRRGTTAWLDSDAEL